MDFPTCIDFSKIQKPTMEVGHPKPQPKKSCWLVQNSQHPHICFYLHLDSKFSRKLSTCHWVCWCRFVFSSIQSPPPPLPQRETLLPTAGVSSGRDSVVVTTAGASPHRPVIPCVRHRGLAPPHAQVGRRRCQQRGPLVSERGREFFL